MLHLLLVATGFDTMTHSQDHQPAAIAGPGIAGDPDTQTPPNVEELAKLPYRRPLVAIPPASLVAALARALEAIEQLPGYLPGVPIVGQALEIEEEYWRHVWRRLGRPDPALTNQHDQG